MTRLCSVGWTTWLTESTRWSLWVATFLKVSRVLTRTLIGSNRTLPFTSKCLITTSLYAVSLKAYRCRVRHIKPRCASGHRVNLILLSDTRRFTRRFRTLPIVPFNSSFLIYRNMSENRAAFLVEPKGCFEVRDAPIEQPGPGEILIKVCSNPLKACRYRVSLWLMKCVGPCCRSTTSRRESGKIVIISSGIPGRTGRARRRGCTCSRSRCHESSSRRPRQLQYFGLEETPVQIWGHAEVYVGIRKRSSRGMNIRSGPETLLNRRDISFSKLTIAISDRRHRLHKSHPT